MYSTSCPNCSAELDVDESLVGRQCLCPSCRTRFRLSESDAIHEQEGDSFPVWLRLFCGGVGVALLGLLVMATIGPVAAGFMVLITGVISIVIWQWQRIPELVDIAMKALRSAKEARELSKQSDTRARSETPDKQVRSTRSRVARWATPVR